jgi:small subunit ribosomal protein S20
MGPFDHPQLTPYNKSFGLTRNILLYTQRVRTDMANHLSAQKRARQTETRTTRNRANTSSLRTQLRDLRESIEKGDKAAIQKGTLHENTASRYKSRLSKRVAAIK